MATALALSPVDPGEIISLDPNEIRLGDRLRPIDEAWAVAIGHSMAREGQIYPVDVRWNRLADTWELAGAGGHRVVGARLVNIPIDAKVVVFGDELARRREAAENLFRRSNDPLERAEAIAELVRLHREQAGIEKSTHREMSASKAFRQEVESTLEIFSNVYGWSEEIGAKIGFTGRTVRNDLFLYRGLKPSVAQLLREKEHPILKNATQLRALARLDGAEQSAVADRLLDGARSLAEAVAAIANRPKPSHEDKRLSAFLGSFSRMGPAEKKGALAHLRGMLPAGFQLVEAN